MRIGVHAATTNLTDSTVYYLNTLLHEMLRIDDRLRPVVFVTPETRSAFPDFDCRLLPESTTGRLVSLRPDRTHVARTAQQANVDVLLSPLSELVAPGIVPVAQFCSDLYDVEKIARKGGWRVESKLKPVRATAVESEALIVPSTYLRDRAREVLGVGLERIAVTSHGVDEIIGTERPPMVEKPYLLVVGDTHRRQNIGRLHEAVRRVWETHACGLVVVGRNGDAEPEDWGDHVIRFERCPMAQLASLYRHAALYISPGLYEGSGHSVCMAMRAGTPVAAARVGAIEEVGHKIPFYFNPRNIDSMTTAILRALNESEGERDARTRVGKQVTAQYTWKTCATTTLATLKRIARRVVSIPA